MSLERLHGLRSELQRHARLYHEDDAPEISDADFDSLKKRNLSIELRFPKLKRRDSPSEIVGAPAAEGFEKIHHEVPLLSLGNIFYDHEVYDFYSSVREFLKLPISERIDDVLAGFSLRSCPACCWSLFYRFLRSLF